MLTWKRRILTADYANGSDVGRGLVAVGGAEITGALAVGTAILTGQRRILESSVLDIECEAKRFAVRPDRVPGFPDEPL